MVKLFHKRPLICESWNLSYGGYSLATEQRTDLLVELLTAPRRAPKVAARATKKIVYIVYIRSSTRTLDLTFFSKPRDITGQLIRFTAIISTIHGLSVFRAAPQRNDKWPSCQFLCVDSFEEPRHLGKKA